MSVIAALIVVVGLSQFLQRRYEEDVRARTAERFRVLSLAGLPLLPDAAVLPTRIFAGPNQYPPKSFAAYGIVAFPSRATKDDIKRYTIICEAYVSTFPFYKEIKAPITEQIVTVWPIDTDDNATRINGMPSDDLCGDAVFHYGLVTALQAIDDAKRRRARIDGLGPFLLAWSPSRQKGVPDALVLVSNLSEVTTSEQAKAFFEKWRHDIEEDPELWKEGWNLEKLRTVLRLWADKYGEQLLQLVGGK
jgi:hypothetical protein